MKKIIAYVLTCVFASSIAIAQCNAQTMKREHKPVVKQEKLMKKKATKTGGAAQYKKTRKHHKMGTKTGGAATTRKKTQKRASYK